MPLPYMALTCCCAHHVHISTLSHRHAAFILDENIFQGRELINSRSLQALMAGLKAYSTWETISCLQDCRECTGGMVSPEAEQPMGATVTRSAGLCIAQHVAGNRMCQESDKSLNLKESVTVPRLWGLNISCDLCLFSRMVWQELVWTSLVKGLACSGWPRRSLVNVTELEGCG